MTKVQHDSETLADGNQVITACGFIHRTVNGRNEVFLAKRADTKKFLPGLYEMPGGHVDFGEDIVAALKREVMEEFNMRITVGGPFAAFTYKNLVKKSHSIEVVYFAQFESDMKDIRIHPEDHSEYAWFSKEDVLRVVAPNRELNKRAPSVEKASEDDGDYELQSILSGFSILEGMPISKG